MELKKTLILSLFFMIISVGSFAQEQAPLKTFKFNISLNKLKTETQAEEIETSVSALHGVRECELVLTEYELNFVCTNHDMNKYMIIDQIKKIILDNEAAIVKINRKEE